MASEGAEKALLEPHADEFVGRDEPLVAGGEFPALDRMDGNNDQGHTRDPGARYRVEVHEDPVVEFHTSGPTLPQHRFSY